MSPTKPEDEMTTRALRIPSLPVLLFTAILGTACGAGSQSQERAAGAAVPQYPIEDFMATTRIGGASFSPDGQKLILHGNTTGVFNIYQMSVGGERRFR
jgi:hypothetical protein